MMFLPIAYNMILFITSGKEITVQAILEYTPKSPLTAAFVILLFYVLNAAT